MMVQIPPRSARALTLDRGQKLKIVDLEGQQVSDLVAFNRHDLSEVLSNGRTFDYEETIYLGNGNAIYSNKSRPMFRIVEDTVGRHDFLLTPCNADTFRIIYGDKDPHRGCHGNLHAALDPHGVGYDDIPTCFNVFMNVPVDGETGKFSVQPPRSKPGDHIVIQAEMDLLVGLTACSAGQSNNFAFKPIGYEVLT